MKITKEFVEETFGNLTKLKTQVNKIYPVYAEAKGLSPEFFDHDEINFEMERDGLMVYMEVYHDSRCGCCTGETSYHNMPAKYLYHTDQLEVLAEEVRAKKLADKLAKDEAEAYKKQMEIIELEVSERKELERLKAKFEK